MYGCEVNILAYMGSLGCLVWQQGTIFSIKKHLTLASKTTQIPGGVNVNFSPVWILVMRGSLSFLQVTTWLWVEGVSKSE